jgi:hypothetical protein
MSPPSASSVKPKTKTPQLSRLAQSSYLSPYSHMHSTSTSAGGGAANPNPDLAGDADAAGDANLYAALRASALAELEAMGFDPRTMAERGVVWAEDQDPFGHVMHSQVCLCSLVFFVVFVWVSTTYLLAIGTSQTSDASNSSSPSEPSNPILIWQIDTRLTGRDCLFIVHAFLRSSLPPRHGIVHRVFRRGRV